MVFVLVLLPGIVILGFMKAVHSVVLDAATPVIAFAPVIGLLFFWQTFL